MENLSFKSLPEKITKGIIESQRMVLKARFSTLYFSKLLNYLIKFGVVLVGTNISNDEYFVCTHRHIIYQEAERLSLSKYNYKTKTHEFFVLKLIDEYNPYYFGKDRQYAAEDIFTESEIILLMDNHLRSIPINNNMRRYLPFSRKGEMLIPYFLRKGIISQIYPQHNPFTIYRMWYKTKTKLLYPLGNDVCFYFGEEIAFYFEWISFYWSWLFYPAAVGILIFFYSFLIGTRKTMDKNPYISLYSTFTIIWGFVFTKFWKRRQAFLAYEWDTFDRKQSVKIRSGFHGEEIFNETTGEYEMHYSRHLRRMKFGVNIVAVIVMSLISFFLIICSFNLRGFISEKTHSGSENFFFIESLSKYSHKNAIFSPRGAFFWVPITMHTTFIYIMNSIIFKRIAWNLTEWENHKTETDFLYYLILKRSLFDSFDSYCGLFYLAFYELDSERLRIVLHGLFISDTVRRIILKSVVPWIFLKVKYQADALLFRTKNVSKEVMVEFWNSVATIDTYMAEYDSFDDHLQMVIAFGYISLFASVSLVPGILALLSNLIDLKTDSMKLLFLFKRPLVCRADATGPWLFIVSFLTWLSVMTNTFIFGITSEQMKHWFPYYFKAVTLQHKNKPNANTDNVGYAFVDQSGHKAVGMLVLIEHIFIIIGLCIHFGINSIPRVIRKKIIDHEILMSNEYMLKLKSRNRASIIQ